MTIRLAPEDIELHLGPRPADRPGAWLHRRLRELLTARSLPAGATLPASRELATTLGLARGTVVTALDALVGEGLLVSRPRSGLRVADAAPGGSPRWRPRGEEPPPSAGLPDPALFPRNAWGRAL